MSQYRVHILDRNGELLGAVDVDCADDEAAKERVEEVLDGHAGELWRRVAVFRSNNPSVQAGQEGPRIRDHKQRMKSH
jgi:hypothetical protein